MLHKPDSALVILGHGSTVNPDSSIPTFQHADEIRRRGLFREVACAFWKEEPGFRQVLTMTESPEVYLVPNFISEGYFTQKVIPRELGLAGPVTAVEDAVGERRMLKYCEPVGNHPRMMELILRRACEVAPGVDRREISLVIVGHGTSLNENSGAAVKEQVRRIAESGEYGEVVGAFMEEEPFVTDWRKLTSRPNVVAVPFFVSDGLHSYQDIPVLLGIEAEPGVAASRAEVFRRNPYLIDGRKLYYASAIGTQSHMAEAMLDMVSNFDLQHSFRAA